MIEVISLLRLDRASSFNLDEELALFRAFSMDRDTNTLGIGMTKMSTSVDKLIEVAR